MENFNEEVIEKLNNKFSKEEIAAQNEQIVELIHQGLTRKEIAKIVGISTSTLYSRIADLRLNGFLPYYSYAKDTTTPEKKILTIREQEFFDLYNEGLTSEEIAEKMHVKIGTIAVYLQRLRDKGLVPREIKVRIKSARINRVRSKIEALIDDFLNKNDEFFINAGLPKRRSNIVVDINKVAEIVKALGFRSKDVHLLEQLYVERGLYENAIALLLDYESNHKLSPKEIDQIGQLKHRLRLELLKKLTGNIPNYVLDSQEPLIGTNFGSER